MNRLFYIKLIIHIIAIICLLFGIILIHTILNYKYNIYRFFEILLHKTTILDIGIIFIGISFFMEFILSFKPIKIIIEVND